MTDLRLTHDPDKGCWGCVFCYDTVACRLGERGPDKRSLLESSWHTDHIGVAAPDWCPLRAGRVVVEAPASSSDDSAPGDVER